MVQRAFLETAVMSTLWSNDDWLTAREVQRHLADEHDVAYTTVLTVLSRLWKKDALKRRRSGRAYEYRPREPRSIHAARRMEEILEASEERTLTLTRFLDNLSASERSKLRRILGRE